MAFDPQAALEALVNDPDELAELAKHGPRNFSLSWGRHADPIDRQVREQGLPDWSPELRYCGRDADALIELNERGLISHRELDRARDKLFARTIEAVRAHADAIVKHRAASGTLTEGGDVEQAPSDSLSGPTGNAGDAQ